MVVKKVATSAAVTKNSTSLRLRLVWSLLTCVSTCGLTSRQGLLIPFLSKYLGAEIVSRNT